MKKTKLYFLFAGITALCLTQFVNAKTWRVNNKSNYDATSFFGDNFGGTPANPVFVQINQAVNLASNGDSIYVEGSTSIYEEAVITKRLVIIGTGYFLTDNPKTSNNTLESQLRRIIFNPGSEGSQLIGVNIVSAGNTADAAVYASANGLTIKRCRIERFVQFGTGLTDVYILENFFSNSINSNVLNTNGNTAFLPPTDIVFNNNICQKTLTWGSPLTNPTTFWPILQCNNNVFDGPDNLANPSLAFSTTEFKNNILMATNAVVNIAASEGNIAYNVGTLATQFGTANNNVVVQPITTLFVTSPSPDGAYQIASGSQASSSGSDGADRGAFGGAVAPNRYTLSGLAAIPVIYQITTPGASSTNFPVTIQARTIK